MKWIVHIYIVFQCLYGICFNVSVDYTFYQKKMSVEIEKKIGEGGGGVIGVQRERERKIKRK